MGVCEMLFTFEREWQAREGLDAARSFIAGSDVVAAEPQLDGMTVAFSRCEGLNVSDLDDDQSFFMQLCFYWATRFSEAPFTGVGRMASESSGGLSAEKVFYDGYVLGFKCLEDCRPELTEGDWREVRWHMWIPLHGHFVDLDIWRTSSDL